MRSETEKTVEAVKALEEAGAKYGQRLTRHNGLRVGWWLDGVYLARSSIDALNLMKGNS